jgi:hypothetical protein
MVFNLNSSNGRPPCYVCVEYRAPDGTVYIGSYRESLGLPGDVAAWIQASGAVRIVGTMPRSVLPKRVCRWITGMRRRAARAAGVRVVVRGKLGLKPTAHTRAGQTI